MVVLAIIVFVCVAGVAGGCGVFCFWLLFARVAFGFGWFLRFAFVVTFALTLVSVGCLVVFGCLIWWFCDVICW